MSKFTFAVVLGLSHAKEKVPESPVPVKSPAGFAPVEVWSTFPVKLFSMISSGMYFLQEDSEREKKPIRKT
jgi:hypothetical protein